MSTRAYINVYVLLSASFGDMFCSIVPHPKQTLLSRDCTICAARDKAHSREQTALCWQWLRSTRHLGFTFKTCLAILSCRWLSFCQKPLQQICTTVLKVYSCGHRSDWQRGKGKTAYDSLCRWCVSFEKRGLEWRWWIFQRNWFHLIDLPCRELAKLHQNFSCRSFSSLDSSVDVS